MLINQHSLVLIMGSLQLFLTLRKLAIEKQAVVSTKRDLPQFVVRNVNKTRDQDGNQGQPKLIMQTCTSGLPSASQICSVLKVPNSINDHIPKDPYSLSYVRVDDAINIIQSLGRGAFTAKTDLKSAFRLIPIHPDDWRWSYNRSLELSNLPAR